ncbi:MAG: putative pyridoxine 5'-phosphate oxidase superfamily flavin-nucleotide-binding protein [Planctomycetota bacterium]|jgi:predicted pyridoxine 5'-phosphate oxidase superfamily flavin-nucleotide-binding protein
MSTLFGDTHRALQDEFETRKLADRIIDIACTQEVGDMEKGFIESRDMFFLASVDANGSPTVSHKGGDAGFLKVLDNKTIIFPSYDGNGMFLSMGNVAASGKIGLLLIDFENPHRMRIQGTANISKEPELLAMYKEAQLVVKVTVDNIFANCPRYIHRYQKVSPSRYVPREACETPIATWKRIDGMQDVISPDDAAKVEGAGGTIAIEEWMEKVMTGDPTA